MSHPSEPFYDPDATVKEALRRYFEAYDLGDGGYEKSYHVIRLVGFLPVIIPNPPSRKSALRRHDLNHVLASYNAIGTSGEIDIAAFEVGTRGGCHEYYVAWAINLMMFAFGLIIRPRHVFRAFVRSRGSQNAYSLAEIDDTLLTKRLRDVRVQLKVRGGIPPASPRDRCAFVAWSAISLLFVIVCGISCAGLLAVIVRKL